MKARALLLGAVTLLIGASLFVGAARSGAGWEMLMISRLPRTLAALLSGAGLALAGAVMQLALRNRLVEPGLTGTPESAMAGLLAVTLAAPGAPVLVKMAAASVAALAGTAGFLLLARHVPRRDPMLLPLVGLIYAGILASGVTWAAWTSDLMQFLASWQVGEFSGVMRGRYELLWAIAGLALALWAAADRITLLSLGEVQARSLGLDYRGTLAIGLAIVAATVAAIVVTVGTLPFVGLIVPNLVSRRRGDNLRASLPVIALAGGVAVLASDLIGRLVRFPYEIPAGAIFAVAGAGLFLWLLHSGPRGAGAHG